MSEFCEKCPMRGQAHGELTSMLAATVSVKRFLGPSTTFNVGAILDDSLGASEPIIMPSSKEMSRRLYTKVDGCDEPELVEQNGILRKKQVLVCPAIGRFAILDSEISDYVKQAISREIVR